MEIKLKGKELPRAVCGGDVQFETLGVEVNETLRGLMATNSVLFHFTPSEVVELVNRAIYHLEYQANAHKKRGQRERDKIKLLKEELKKRGIDPKRAAIDKQLKGE